jgi:hypothetical protein
MSVGRLEAWDEPSLIGDKYVSLPLENTLV